jgi:hypothetical protein
MWDTFGYTNLQSTRRGKETYRVRTFLVVLLAIHATTVDGPSDLRALVLAVGIHTNRAVYASKNLDYSGKKFKKDILNGRYRCLRNCES